MPIEKEKPRTSVNKLLAQLEDAKCAKHQIDGWRTSVAGELNTILERAQYYLEQRSDMDFAIAALRVAVRVSEFEGIRKAK